MLLSIYEICFKKSIWFKDFRASENEGVGMQVELVSRIRRLAALSLARIHSIASRRDTLCVRDDHACRFFRNHDRRYVDGGRSGRC
jgi:hypothetical protein